MHMSSLSLARITFLIYSAILSSPTKMDRLEQARRYDDEDVMLTIKPVYYVLVPQVM